MVNEKADSDNMDVNEIKKIWNNVKKASMECWNNIKKSEDKKHPKKFKPSKHHVAQWMNEVEYGKRRNRQW